MPVCLNGNMQNLELLAGARRLTAKLIAGNQAWSGRCVNIGIVNNMPDGALEATERQFVSLLDAAADGILVRVCFYGLPDVPRNDWARHRIKHLYSSIEGLWNSQLDGLIVTGREPRTSNLKDEPYWESMTRVVDWAEDNTHSTVWSCLAAHAALLYMDGIVRRKSQEKRCGVFDCVRLSDHPLLAGLSSHLKVPHSRWNDIAEDDLAACGYRVLSRAEGAGADMIVKRRNSLFVFFQGHPEYEPDTLQLEYRRDVRRYLAGETDTYPLMPQNYFDKETEDALTALQQKALCRRSEDLLADAGAMFEGKPMAQPWRSTATRIYSNWLAYISAQKEERFSQSLAATNAHR